MNLYELSRRTDQLLQHPSTAAHFSSSFEKLIEFLAIAIELKGRPGWYLEVNKRLGSDLTEEEAERLEAPLSVLYRKMVGGMAPVAATQGAGASDPPYYEWWTLKFLKGLADKVQEIGPFNYNKTDGVDSDIPIGNTIANALTLIPVVKAAEAAENAVPGDAPKVFKTIRGIVLPYRAAGMIAHTLLSISRFRGATSPNDSPFWRQIMSAISALLELMMGDWKSAALSIAGIYSQHAAYAGIVGQLVLSILSMMDPVYQENIIGGLTAVPKSILVGLLLYAFQTFSTNEVRRSAIEILANLEQNIEMKLTESIEQSAFKAELVAAKQTGVSELNFGRINLLQKMIHRKAMVCDKEFQHIFEHNNVSDNAVLLILFKLMDIPLTKEEYGYMCPTDKWASGMFAQHKKEIQPCRPVVAPTAAPAATPTSTALEGTAPAPTPKAEQSPPLVAAGDGLRPTDEMLKKLMDDRPVPTDEILQQFVDNKTKIALKAGDLEITSDRRYRGTPEQILVGTLSQPPGSSSYAFLEEGQNKTSYITNTSNIAAISSPPPRTTSKKPVAQLYLASLTGGLRRSRKKRSTSS